MKEKKIYIKGNKIYIFASFQEALKRNKKEQHKKSKQSPRAS